MTQTGEVTPVIKVDLFSESSGRIETVLVKEGQSIKRGDTILTIDAERLLYRKQNLALAVRKAKIRKEKAARDLSHAESLIQTGTISSKVLSDLKSDFELAEISFSTRKPGAKGYSQPASKNCCNGTDGWGCNRL